MADKPDKAGPEAKKPEPKKIVSVTIKQGVAEVTLQYPMQFVNIPAVVASAMTAVPAPQVTISVAEEGEAVAFGAGAPDATPA